MKMKSALLVALVLVSAGACKKSGSGGDTMAGSSPEALAKEFSDAMCGKIVECQNKHLEKMPANVREMAKGQMMTEAKCREMTKNPGGKAEGKNMWTKLTDAEKASAMRCMKAMPKASCDTIMRNAVSECVEWQKIAESKKG